MPINHSEQNVGISVERTDKDTNIQCDDDVVGFDSTLDDGENFLDAIKLYMDESGNEAFIDKRNSEELTVNSKMSQNINSEELNQGCEGNEAEVCKFHTDHKTEKQIHALYISMLNKDYANFTALVNEYQVDINHVFYTEPYIEIQFQGWKLVHFVCKTGDVKGLDTIISLGADPSAKTGRGDTALHICCRYGHHACVEYLLDVDDSLKDVRNNEGISPLLQALSACPRFDKEIIFLETVKLLVNSGCDVNHVSDNFLSPLHLAARTWNCESVIYFLVKAGADVNAIVLGSTPLIEAVKTTHKSLINQDVIKLLIQAGAFVNFQDRSGRFPISYVLRDKRISKKLVKLLLNAGANRDVESYNGLDSHLMTAALAGNYHMVKLLRALDTGMNVPDHESDANNAKQPEKDSTLCLAVIYGYHKMVKYLLEYGANPNAITYYGDSALYLAVQRNDISLTRLLLEYGAEVNNISSAFKISPLSLAAEYRNEEMVKMLLDNGADTNTSTEYGATALHFAVYYENIRVMKILLQRNCAMRKDRVRVIPTDDVSSSLNLFEIALTKGNEEIVKLLYEVGCPVTEPLAMFERLHTVFKSDGKLVGWLNDFSHKPRTLLHICVVYIRKLCGPQLYKVLETLNIEGSLPLKLIDIILMKDMLIFK